MCEFYTKGRKITYFFNPKELDSIANLNITFTERQYDTLNVKDRVVADVGAAYGDTALFFALNGAKKVYAYEPVPWVAEILRKNVEANGLGRTIEPLPFAVSDREGEALLSVPKTTAAASLLYCHGEAESFRVKTVTPPSDADVLKLNCEGCEYAIILNWLKSRLYDQIEINYHAEHVELAKKLRRLGYKVKVFSNTHILVAT